MSSEAREKLRKIRTFPSLVRFLRDELDWPVESDDFEELTFDYEPEELGIDAVNAAKIDEIKRLRPLVANQPWGIFFVKFEPKRLPVVALRRILAGVVLKKRATASDAEQPKWAEDDLLFISNYGEGDERRISFAHFSRDPTKTDLPTLKVIAWDELDTPLHLQHTAGLLAERLAWPSPEDEWNGEAWRDRWRSAFELRHQEVISTSKALAERLAELARRIRAEILRVLEIETHNGTVTRLMKAFQEALVHDLDADGFADMYAQTITYGLLSARIADPNGMTADDFAGHMRTNPFLRELMQAFLMVGDRPGKAIGVSIDFDELGVREVAQVLDAANMEAVVRDFGDKNPLEDPVIHFYELFLTEYDPKKRMLRGVFYTPRPVVSCIVHAVDQQLRREFGLEDGLADTATWGDVVKRDASRELPEGVQSTDRFVTVLDPATGTGTFLVEAIEVIHGTLIEKWTRDGHGVEEALDLWNDYVPRHLLPRLHGYEIMMAPYAIAHLKIGLKLHETGYRFTDPARARVYLTNALEPPHDFSGQLTLALPALAHEAQAVNHIKAAQRFTVVVGNPPYAQSQTENTWILDLMRRYRQGMHERKSDTNREEWKFLRFATYEVVRSSVGIVAYVINNSWLDAPTLREIRGHVVEQFDEIAIVNLHGDSNKRETAPDGSQDANVFAIKQGVCVTRLTRGFRDGIDSTDSVVRYGDLWGTQAAKYGALLDSKFAALCDESVAPDKRFRRFVPSDRGVDEEYQSGASIAEFWPPVCGIETKRDHFAIDIDRLALNQRITDFAESALSEDDLKQRFDVRDNDWVVVDARRRLQQEGWADAIVPCVYRPFDLRWILYRDYVLARDRGPLMASMTQQNLGIVVPRQTKEEFGALIIDSTCTHKIVTVYDRSFLFPLYRYSAADQLGASAGRSCNIDRGFLQRFADGLGLSLLDDGRSLDCGTSLGPEDFCYFVYAQFYAPSYRERFRALLKIDYPRIFEPGSAELFASLALLGAQLAGVHLLETTSGHDALAVYQGPTNPEVERVGWSHDAVWLDCPAPRKGRPTEAGTVGFCRVPEPVWDFHIGGYRVCEKWLKDRKGRILAADDIAHYRKLVNALSATIGLMAEIDSVIDAHGGWPSAFGSWST